MLTVTKILLARSFLYIFCQSFKVIPDIFEAFACKPFHYELGGCPFRLTQIVNAIVDISHLFLIVNSSVNVVLYIVYGERFHESLNQVRGLKIGNCKFFYKNYTISIFSTNLKFDSFLLLDLPTYWGTSSFKECHFI